MTTRPITGRTVLIGFLAFFGLIFAVNGAFVYFALDSWPGLRYDKAYERGVNYNKVLSDAEAQAKLQWKSAVVTSATGDGAHRLLVRLVGPEGAPVTGAKVQVDLSRPTNESEDHGLTLAPTAPGEYAADFRFAALGRWLAALTVQGAGGETYKMTHDIVVKQ